jgi:YfiH family protein
MPDFIIPDWPAPPHVRALATTRAGGVSAAPWDSLNLGEHVGDRPEHVAENRRRLLQHLPAEPRWLQQVHGVHCLDAALVGDKQRAEADAAFTTAPGVVCAVLTADCLPVLLCDAEGTVVAAAHAGWRGLAAGVLESTVATMGRPREQLLAWLGPAIGPENFEVGAEVRDLFMAHDHAAAAAFLPGVAGKWQCNIYLLAQQRLLALGVRRITGAPKEVPLGGADFCTVRDPERFYSYRRNGITGRMASLIWIDATGSH